MMSVVFFLCSCIEPPSLKFSSKEKVHLDVRMFQYASLEGILIDEIQSNVSRDKAILYVGSWNSNHLNCLINHWNSNQRVLIVTSENDIEPAMTYLQNQGFENIQKEVYPCR